MTEIQTPPQGTEQEQVIPQVDPKIETPPIETPPDEVQPETPAAEASSEPQTPPPGYVPKEKFVASAQESILNAERVNVANARIESLTKQDTPTDEAMRQVYSDWDELNEITKRTLIKQEAQEMRQRREEAETQDIRARQQLDDKLEEFLETPPEPFKKIVGKEAEFKRFAKKKNNIGLSLETLAKAFLFDAEEETPPTPMREALPAGSGGPRDPLKPVKISIEEAAEIRKTDYKRYMELINANAIEEIK